MTHAKVTSKLVTKAFASSLVAVGLALAGCGTEKIESSPDRTSKEIFEKSVDQGRKGKKGDWHDHHHEKRQGPDQERRCQLMNLAVSRSRPFGRSLNPFVVVIVLVVCQQGDCS